eukprot:gb/GEZJ01001185.1/.p2 GENE.gb/GEZJ01001185.1/~~gb/GEZJ01001185.1/.p2  ORF type:complete len:195 (-),score=22.21 gb/GEZJ01001185.1/:552-1136(-)
MASNPPQVAEVDVENPPPLAHGDSELNTKPAVKNLNRLTSCFRGERRVYGTGKSIPEEFRDFIFGGNLIRIAVAFILALALERMVEQFVASFITPIIGVIGAESFEDLTFTVRSSKFRYGLFLDSFISFFVICVTLFFCLILPLQKYGGRFAPSWIVRKCPYCYSEMAAIANKCPSCGSDVEPIEIGKVVSKTS